MSTLEEINRLKSEEKKKLKSKDQKKKKKKSKKVSNPYKYLERYFDFTTAELERNRMGKLSERQKEKLRKKERQNGKYQILMVLFLLVVTAAMGFRTVATLLEGPWSTAWPSWVSLAILYAFVFVAVIAHQRKKNRYINDGIVLTLAGKVHRYRPGKLYHNRQSYQDYPRHFIRDGIRKYFIGYGKHLNIMDGQTFRIYYIPNGPVPYVVSIEPYKTVE